LTIQRTDFVDCPQLSKSKGGRALMRQLVEKDATIEDRLEGYVDNGDALTEDFKTQAAAFRRHAQMYVLRFGVLPNYVPFGDQFEKAEPFPDGFPSALAHEIASRKALASPK
jgi:hypothetical protein